MHRPDYIAADYKRLGLAESFTELSRRGFKAEENVLLYSRPSLSADFKALTQDLYRQYAGHSKMIDSGQVRLFSSREKWWIGPQGHEDAVQQIQQDILQMMRRPHLRALRFFLNGPEGVNHNNEVGRFHVDGNANETPWERMICCYSAMTTEAVQNEDAVAPADMTSSGLFYGILPGARVFRFRLGDIWRQRNYYAGVENAFVHRAPDLSENPEPRLMLVADYNLK